MEARKNRKKYEELRASIGYLIRSVTKNCDDYDEKHR